MVLADELAHIETLCERVLRAERLETIGRMVGGITHDFNNLLAGVVAEAEVLAYQLTAHPTLQHKAKSIGQIGMHAAGLALRLRDFSKAKHGESFVADLHATIGEVVQLLRAGSGPSLHLELRLDAAVTQVRVDPAALCSIILNLGLNARDAMPAGGTLTIATAVTFPTSAQRSQLVLPLEGDQHVELVLADTGMGMDEAVRARLFEPFFTTKGQQGNGLGMMQIADALRECGGSLLVESAPHQGTSFRVWLPSA